ncbi:hypothetical protein AVEN_196806-1, partial [Araneus ventricosus]
MNVARKPISRIPDHDHVNLEVDRIKFPLLPESVAHGLEAHRKDCRDFLAMTVNLEDDHYKEVPVISWTEH